MVVVHDLSEVNVDPQSSIWLYGSIGYFIHMIENGDLPTDNVRRHHERNTEALLSDDCFTSIQGETNGIIKNVTCMSEFYSTGGDTRSIWAQHSPHRVALRTSVDQLTDALSEKQFEIHIVPVTNYCQLDSVSINPDDSTPSEVSVSDYVSQFSYKDQSYDREQAIRVVGIHSRAVDENGIIDLRKTTYTQIGMEERMVADRDVLMDEIIVSPHASGWVADLLQEYAEEDFNMPHTIYPSSLS